MPTEIVLIGGGGHCKVVLDALVLAGRSRAEIVVMDQAINRISTMIMGIQIRSYDARLVDGCKFHICIGNNMWRRKLFNELLDQCALIVAHPSAVISSESTIGPGSFVAARAVVGPGANIGISSIINHSAVVDHDVMLGNFCHIAPGATLAGNVRIDSGVLVGAGANILPGVTVGEDSVVGAGAVVISDVPAGTTYAGIPAREIRR